MANPRVVSDAMSAERVRHLARQPAVQAEQAEDGRADSRNEDQQREIRDDVPHPHHVLLNMKAISRAKPNAMPSA